MLDDVYNSALGIENQFAHKCILVIPSESYDAQTITVLQGLEELGFTVKTFKRNINTWFCEQVVSDVSTLVFDFVLSGLHWGTRWTHYKTHKLHNYPRVLIDGDDTMIGDTWEKKLERYAQMYKMDPPDIVKNASIAPYRWVEPHRGYRPDVVFTLGRNIEQSGQGRYIPKGIHREYLTLAGVIPTEQRAIDFAHIPGNGVWRTAMSALCNLGLLPGLVVNGEARGNPIYPPQIAPMADQDNNVHSYHRWACWSEYYKLLNNTKVIIHPGIDHYPFWETKRIYEGWACGCVVAMSTPTVDVSDYPPTEVCPEAVYEDHAELVEKARYWYDNPDYLNWLAGQSREHGQKFFSPVAIARYFLKAIKEEL